MDKLLIIGATGLLGSKALELAERRYESYGTYNTNKKKSLLQLDVTDKSAVDAIFNKLHPDFVLDTHALNNVDYCELHRNEAFNINVAGSVNIIGACYRLGAKYASISSDYVFDGKKSLYTEKSLQNPLNYYGRTKWAAEIMPAIVGLDAIVARTSSIYGIGSSTGKKSFVPWLIENLKKGNSTDVLSDLYYSPTYNIDLAKTAFDLYDAEQSGLFNVVGSDCISKYTFAQMISKEFELDTNLLKPISSTDLNQSAKRPRKAKLSVNKLVSAIAQKPVGVKHGLKLLHKEMIERGLW